MASRIGRLFLILSCYCTYYSVHSAETCSLLHIGKFGCVQIPSYDAPVYATCLTDSYAKLKNNYKGACANSVTFQEVDSCWFSCMLELHGKDRGHVTNDCRCSFDGGDRSQPEHIVPSTTNRPEHTTQATKPLTTSISNTCHSPDGKDCQFYERCLRAKNPCPFTINWDDIIHFGSSICKLPHYQKTSLSENGTLWVTATQECIQGQMAPLLKPLPFYLCHLLDITSEAIFEQCLDKPLDKIEMCDVPLEDLWSVFWTLRAESNSNFVSFLSQFYAKTRNCSFGIEIGVDSFRTLVIEFSPATYEGDFEDFVAKVVESESWKEKGLIWYAEESYNDGGPEIRLLFTKRKGSTDRTMLDQSLDAFADKFETGKYKYTFSHRLIKPKAMYVCEDLGCIKRTTERNFESRNSASKLSTGLIILGVLGSIFLLVAVVGGIYFAYNKRRKGAFDHHRLVETS